jgi:hypothetical protein
MSDTIYVKMIKERIDKNFEIIRNLDISGYYKKEGEKAQHIKIKNFNDQLIITTNNKTFMNKNLTELQKKAKKEAEKYIPNKISWWKQKIIIFIGKIATIFGLEVYIGKFSLILIPLFFEDLLKSGYNKIKGMRIKSTKCKINGLLKIYLKFKGESHDIEMKFIKNSFEIPVKLDDEHYMINTKSTIDFYKSITPLFSHLMEILEFYEED